MSRAEYLSCLAIDAIVFALCAAVSAFFYSEGAPLVFCAIPVAVVLIFVVSGVEVARVRRAARKAGL